MKKKLLIALLTALCIVASTFGFTSVFANGTEGALEVGKASTKAVVNSSIVILLLDVVLTNLMLN